MRKLTVDELTLLSTLDVTPEEMARLMALIQGGGVQSAPSAAVDPVISSPTPAPFTAPAPPPKAPAPTVYAASKYSKETQEELDMLRAELVGIEKLCPHCKESKPIIPFFGIGVNRDSVRVQPWCAKCRATTSENYRKSGRKAKRGKQN